MTKTDDGNEHPAPPLSGRKLAIIGHSLGVDFEGQIRLPQNEYVACSIGSYSQDCSELVGCGYLAYEGSHLGFDCYHVTPNGVAAFYRNCPSWVKCDLSPGRWRNLADQWARDYILAQDEIALSCLLESLTDEEWAAHLEFITQCFQNGIKPTHFIDELIRNQQEWNELNDDNE